jgi:hypothetical protein
MKHSTTCALSAAFAAALFTASLTRACPPPEKPSVPAAPATPVPVVEATPVGIWAWHNNAKTVSIHADGTVGQDHKEGTWKWIDQTKRTLQIDWVSGWVDKLTIASDGKTMKVVNNAGDRYTVRRLPPTNEYEPPSNK